MGLGPAALPLRGDCSSGHRQSWKPQLLSTWSWSWEGGGCGESCHGWLTWPFCHGVSPETADLIGEIFTDFPGSGKTWGSTGRGPEVGRALEIKESVRAELPTAPGVCVRAAWAVQLLWELSSPALGDVVLPGNAALPRQGAGRLFHLHSAHSGPVLPRTWLWCT